MNNIRSSRPVAIWIMTGVFMLVVQVLLGGITRLTGSGLSITQWDVVTGVLPPLNQQQWLTEFHNYQGSPQYRLLNMDFTLSDFKYIFFWEWFHRFWARLISVVFLVPFVLFLIRRQIRQDMILPLVILFLLGALQGAVGWIMVASGLQGDAIYVNPVKLAMHFVFAMVLISYAFWFGLQLLVPRDQRFGEKRLKGLSAGILALLVIQLAFGAFMAGNKAAPAAATWPSINGMAWPEGLWKDTAGIANFAENKITIHFVHRGLAYLIFLVSVIWGVLAAKATKHTRSILFRKTFWVPLALVSLQVLLGIFTVLLSLRIVVGRWGIFEWMAQLHQMVAMFLVLSVLYVFYLVSGSLGRKG